VRQTQILLVAAGIGLGALVWTRFSGSSWVPLEESERAVSGVDGEAAPGDDGWSESGRATGGGSRGQGSAGHGSASRFAEKHVGRDLGGSAHGRRAGGSATTVSSGSREHAGKLGFSASSRGSAGGGSGVAIARGGTSAGRDLADSLPTRSDVKDFLAQAQPPVDTATNPDDKKPDDNSEVVFSAPLNSTSGTEATEGPPPLVEQDLTLADSGDGVKFDTNSVLAFPDAGNAKNDAGTITFEFEPDWEGGESGDYNFVNVRTPNDPRNLLRVYKNGRYLRFLFADNTGRERNIGYDMVDFQAGERHRVTATYGDNQTALYVDNQLVGTNTYEGQLEIPPGTPLYLGSDVPQAGPSGAGATISNFEIFGRTLARNEVAGLPIGQKQ
jgi:Concanavalin A-like lectin/glucanases superfamily